MSKTKKICIAFILIIMMILSIVANTKTEAAGNDYVDKIVINFINEDTDEYITEQEIEVEYTHPITTSTETDPSKSNITTTNGQISIYHSADYSGRIKVLNGPSGFRIKNISFDYNITGENEITIFNLQNLAASKIKKETHNDGVYIYLNIPTKDVNNALNIDTVDSIGDAVEFVANNDSESQSVSVSDTVSYLSQNGINVTRIQDFNGNNLDLNSTELIGTGATIKTDIKDYTVVVYGDATGDGHIDSSDISVAIDYFLGENENINNVFKVAGDVFKDDDLNAADISKMINCFLGNLDGNILD